MPRRNRKAVKENEASPNGSAAGCRPPPKKRQRAKGSAQSGRERRSPPHGTLRPAAEPSPGAMNAESYPSSSPRRITWRTIAIAAAEEELGDSGRVLVRVSGTEPLVRVMLEGRDEKQIQRLGESIAEVVRERLI